VLRWRGHTNLFESLYIIPGGFGTGVALSTTFIGLAAGVEPADIAIAGTGLYQAQNIGVVVGLSVVGSLLRTTLRPQLEEGLRDIKDMERIIDRSVSDIGYVQSLTGHVRNVVVNSYVQSMMYARIASLIAAALTFLIALLVREHKL
jgi:ABC-type Fe3+ transport system permease subunit